MSLPGSIPRSSPQSATLIAFFAELRDATDDLTKALGQLDAASTLTETRTLLDAASLALQRVHAANQSQTPPASPVKLSAKELKGNARLVNLLRNAVEAEADDEGWAGLGAVGSHISKQASFDSRNFGYAKLSDLIQAIGLFEINKRDKGLYVRDKRPAKKPAQ